MPHNTPKSTVAEQRNQAPGATASEGQPMVDGIIPKLSFKNGSDFVAPLRFRMSETQFEMREAAFGNRGEDGATVIGPGSSDLGVLSPFERFAFHFTHRMNLGRWKRFWTWCQSFFGAGWIHISTYNLMKVYGLQHVEAVDHAKPILLVANHRSFFDLYVVSTTLFRKTKWRKQLFFPVRGRFYYQDPVG